MAETKEAQPNHIQVAHICIACERMNTNPRPEAVFDRTFVKSSCDTACKDGVCRIIPKGKV